VVLRLCSLAQSIPAPSVQHKKQVCRIIDTREESITFGGRKLRFSFEVLLVYKYVESFSQEIVSVHLLSLSSLYPVASITRRYPTCSSHPPLQ
jgi:hypothetical protein